MNETQEYQTARINKSLVLIIITDIQIAPTLAEVSHAK